MVLVSLPLLAVIFGGQHGLPGGDLDLLLLSPQEHLLAVPGPPDAGVAGVLH